MPLLHSNGGLFLRAIKHGINEVQNHLHHEPQHAFEDRRPGAQFKIIIYANPNNSLQLPPSCAGYQPSHSEIVTIDRYKMSPGDGTSESVVHLASEASESLVELSKLSKRVGVLKTQFDELKDHSHWPGSREKLQPVLERLSRVQDETKASIKLSTKLLQGHLEFCRCMQATLRHAATAGNSRLTHDSAVVSAGAVVRERFAALGEHIVTLQDALLDVAQQLRELGERGRHALRHPRSHHVWGKIRQALPEIVRAVMLVISWIGKIMGLVHPVASIVGEVAKGVHDFLGNHASNKHTGSGDHCTSTSMESTAASEQHSSEGDEVLKILDYICDETPAQIAQIRSGLEDVYSNIEQPMLKLEKKLEAGTQCFRMDPRDAQLAADMWEELAEKLHTMLGSHY